jgi:hypothetical protein
MNPGTIRLPADAELSVHVKKTIAIEKSMLIVSGEFTGSHTIAVSQKIAQ